MLTLVQIEIWPRFVVAPVKSASGPPDDMPCAAAENTPAGDMIGSAAAPEPTVATTSALVEADVPKTKDVGLPPVEIGITDISVGDVAENVHMNVHVDDAEMVNVFVVTVHA